MRRFHSALRFDHPDLDPIDLHSGLRLSPSGRIETVEEDASIRQAILMLLSTAPGERVMRPNYGCEIYKLIFGRNDDTTAGLAAHYVRRALEYWEPRIRLLRVDAEHDHEQPERLRVVVEYRIRRCPAARRQPPLLVQRIHGPPPTCPRTRVHDARVARRIRQGGR